MADLFLSNIPYDCSEPELLLWIESQGFAVESLRMIQDLVTGVSPSFAYVRLRQTGDHAEAIRVLDRKCLRDRTLHVQEDWRRSVSNAA